MTDTITNQDDVIDSRDIIARIEDLEGSKVEQWVAGWNMAGYMPDSDPQTFTDFDDAKQYIVDAVQQYIDDAPDSDNLQPWEEFKVWIEDQTGEFSQTVQGMAYWITQEASILEDEDEAKELAVLLSVQEEAEGYSPDWRYGATLIREDYFEDYARQLAEDIGAINSDVSWPNNCIDWEKAANELQVDYTSIDFDGVTYWIR